MSKRDSKIKQKGEAMKMLDVHFIQAYAKRIIAEIEQEVGFIDDSVRGTCIDKTDELIRRMIKERWEGKND
jgi:hypothetical protein